MVGRIDPPELQLNKASFLDLHLSISKGFVINKFTIELTDYMMLLYLQGVTLNMLFVQ